MAVPPEMSAYPLCSYFLTGYLSKRNDAANFPPHDYAGVFRNYENVFESALGTLNLSKEQLKKKPEFCFDSGDAGNLESAIAVLRVVNHLHTKGFQRITLLPQNSTTGADITCTKNGETVCCEVKAITKLSTSFRGGFLADQVHHKVAENISKVRTQLKATATSLACTLTMAVSVMNWMSHSVILTDDDYQAVVDRLGTEQELDGIDLVLIVTAVGTAYGYRNERAKAIDS